MIRTLNRIEGIHLLSNLLPLTKEVTKKYKITKRKYLDQGGTIVDLFRLSFHNFIYSYTVKNPSIKFSGL